jgi:single-stranded-DNA-specific exonuclease
MVEKRWSYKKLPECPEAEAEVAELARVLNVTPFLATLLWQRDITDFDCARCYFRPGLDHLHDPFLMRDMDRAVDRLERALATGEKILIYGDYDVDGTTSVALVYGFLKTRYEHLAYYIPDRYREGYGVQRPGIAYALEHGYSLVITLDCGIKSVDLIAEAQTEGLDFIVCDHHRPGDVIPPAVAVLDPKRVDCEYPYDELTGCGVGFKLLQAYCQRAGVPESDLFEYLDLVVVSIASDIVPITGENRVLSHYGLQRLNESPRAGLKALIKIAQFQQRLDITNVVFGLGPRINAAGRIAHAHQAVELLLCPDEERALEFAGKINVHNTDRRDFDTRITAEALHMIEADDWLRAAKSTVLFKDDWHKGVIGIVASRCIERYYRPTIILTKSHEKAAGSARSVAGFDVYEAIEACSDLLEQFGGHRYAAGLTLKVENIPAFQRRFEEVVTSKLLPEHLQPILEVDMRLPLSEVTEKFHRIVQQMAPFGPQNMTPIFASEVRLRGLPRVLKEKHLKFSVGDGPCTFDAIGFNLGHYFQELIEWEGRPFQICYQVDINEFQGRRNLQLVLKDLKF